jgi:SAM-dependent methyltransferase
MNETTKSRKIWGTLEKSVLRGRGIDIGCGPDPVTPEVRRFDLTDGDANHITRHVTETFDFVYSSHCLEHMDDPRAALQEWWRLVKSGGHLFFIVPDEDLYEQGVFPSRFNPDHKATFTLSTKPSWSPVSMNVRELAESLPGGEVVSLVLQDHNYDHSLLRHGAAGVPQGWRKFCIRVYQALIWRKFPRIGFVERWQARHLALDQTRLPDVLAQIQCIVRKMSRTDR